MRVVLDTNIIISAVVFSSSQITWFRETWKSGQITPLVDKACTEELVRALTYPKFKLSVKEIESLLGEYLPYTVTIVTTHKAGIKIPKCRDPHDQKFLELAWSGKAKALITGDRALLALTEQTPFAILTPAEFREYFQQHR